MRSLSQRGRELYTRLQYYYTPIRNVPFYLALVIPAVFSSELESSKNLTEVIPVLRRVLSAGGPDRIPKSGVSIVVTGWFKQSGGSSEKEALR